MLDGCTAGTTWKLLSLLRDVRGLSSNNGVRCKSKSRCRTVSSPRLWYLLSRIVVYEVPGGCRRWRLGLFVFINQQNTEVEPRNRWNSSIYTTCSRLHLVSVFLTYYTHRQYPNLDIMWLVQTNATRSQTHPITYTTLYFPFGLPSTKCNYIIMLTLRM